MEGLALEEEEEEEEEDDEKEEQEEETGEEQQDTYCCKLCLVKNTHSMVCLCVGPVVHRAPDDASG